MIPTKECTKCLVSKPCSEFYSTKARTKDGLRKECKSCWKLQCKEYHLKNKQVRKSQVREQHYQRRYCISAKEFDELVKKNKGVCPICNEEKRLVLDHCHATGKIRNAICSSCNHALGCAKDNKVILSNMITYLETH